MFFDFTALLSVRGIISLFFFALAMYFCLSGTIGAVRLPDFYARCHASGNCETLSLIMLCIGLIFQSGANILSVKLVILCLLVCICNPIGTNVLCQTAYTSGYPVYRIPDRVKRTWEEEYKENDTEEVTSGEAVFHQEGEKICR